MCLPFNGQSPKNAQSFLTVSQCVHRINSIELVCERLSIFRILNSPVVLISIQLSLFLWIPAETTMCVQFLQRDNLCIR